MQRMHDPSLSLWHPSSFSSYVNAWNLAHAELALSRQSWIKSMVFIKSKFWSFATLRVHTSTDSEPHWGLTSLSMGWFIASSSAFTNKNIIEHGLYVCRLRRRLFMVEADTNVSSKIPIPSFRPLSCPPCLLPPAVRLHSTPTR